MPGPLLYALFALVLLLGGGPACSAASTDTVSPGDVVAGDDRVVSNNGKFALGFFRAPVNTDGGESSAQKWFLGIWFNTLPSRTTVWVANGADPVMDGASADSPELTVSGDGDLVVLHPATKSITWSTQSANVSTKNTTTNNTAAVLLNSGNLVLLETSNLSDQPRTLWQSFDHPTDTLLPGAKLGRDKLTGLNRRLVSRKSMAGPSPGPYCFEVDDDAPQLVLKLCNSFITYWSSGTWNGHYFSNIPELIGFTPNFHLAFVNNSREEYLQFNVTIEVVTRNIIDVNGQNKHQVWVQSSQDWLTLYSTPKIQCDVHGICGPFSVCSYSLLPLCSCMKGFSVSSVKDWEQGDRTGGCVRKNSLDCVGSNTSEAASTDKFYSMSNIILPDKAQSIQDVGSSDECSKACLSSCSCTAYFYGSKGCLVWHTELLNAKLQQNHDGTGSNGEILYLRLSARDMQTSNKHRVTIGVVVGACVAAFAVLVFIAVLLIIRRKCKSSSENYGSLIAFRYKDLRSATKNFSEKIGEGGFGSVFKGQLRDSTGIAVKRLDGSFQGEKQFRAEVRSIGTIQHINLVNLIGFCSDGHSRFLVYEHMPNRSLDINLFQSNGEFLDWSTRYQIAIGVARGLCYLHESCHDRIIHCDIKPQNILLDASFLPKIADFGMAKFVGRDFSRALTTMRGTMGYLAPEWISGTAITPKVDVYSYGMVLLELVSGRTNLARSEEQSSTSASTNTSDNHAVYFPMQASRKLLDGDVMSLLDQKLSGEAGFKEVERICKIACWCIQDNEEDRPTMGQVVQILEGVVDCDMPPLPRFLQSIFERPSSDRNSSSVLLLVGTADCR
ncbi:G-type lectin S-receptor-like serine/threonine-protein kinase At2g19130 [Oryza brachyantha]|uniref:Receptor-like serine/threonine-protein kinase n=1 Tax=Oryza brachyantha TaxID=4533 RepID=J3KWJ2_ORYBR|nr:G-type lectin S-receptor-like serine/threonine-protein kinase At2g19130 [Oryza brachyantha]